MAVGDAVLYDPFTFRKHFKNIGRAYREQATTLIEICRLYAEGSPQTYTKDDHLQNILGLADAALSAAGRAKKGKTPEATNAFLRVQEEIKIFGSPSPRKEVPGEHRKTLLDPRTALESASKRDEKSSSTLSKVKSAFKAPLPRGNIKNVNFVILESLHQQRKDQLIINQEIDNSTTTAEIVWRFSRYPEESGQRITSKQNPHFYVQLPKDAASFNSQFHKDPLRDFAHGYRQIDTIYVLLDKSCRLFLDAHIPRVFGNLWKPHRTVILKDVGGILDSEDNVLRDIAESQDYWHRPTTIIDSSQRRVQLGGDNEIVNSPVGNGRALVDAALRSQNVDLMIRDQSRPEPPTNSGWKLLPSLKPRRAKVQEPEDQTTPRQSPMRLPQLEFSNLNAGVPSTIGGSTQFAPSTESFETVVNTSEVSLPMRGVAGKQPQAIDSAIDLRVEVPQPATHLPHIEYSNPNPSVPSTIGGSTLFSPSTESLETVDNSTSGVSLPMRVAAAKRPQSINSAIDLRVEVPQPATHLPHLEYSNPNPSVPGTIGGSTLFSPSTESLETVDNSTSGVSLPMRVAAAKRPQSIDSEIGLRVQVPQPATRLPHLEIEYSNSNPSIPSTIGGSTQFTQSFEMVVSPLEVSLPKRVAVGKRPQSTDSMSAIDPRVEVPQPATRLPRLEYSNPNPSIPSTIGGSMLFTPSTESLGTVDNTSGVSLPMRVAGKRPQSIDSGIGLRVEVQTADTISAPPPSAPLANLTIPSPLPGQESGREPLSAPPVRKWQAPGSWFKKYEYDYESESWRRRGS